MDGRRARIVLGVGNDAGPVEIRRAFRARALVTHPDHGGDASSFAELVDALAALEDVVAASVFAGRERQVRDSTADSPRFDAYDSRRRPAPTRSFADVLQAATAGLV
ncbi:MAG: DnaJ domain [Actinomycetota bacterium]|nr:DnaJ domain [Actinomycetota bacterium]